MKHPASPRASRIVAFASLAVLSACATSESPRETSFISNGVWTKASNSRVAQLRSYWSQGSRSTVAASKMSDENIRWTLDFIAVTHSSGPTPCLQLDLEQVTVETLAPFTIHDHARGKPITYSPKKYLESWAVKACGKSYRWRVLDDPNDRNEHTVLLFG